MLLGTIINHHSHPDTQPSSSNQKIIIKHKTPIFMPYQMLVLKRPQTILLSMHSAILPLIVTQQETIVIMAT